MFVSAWWFQTCFFSRIYGIIIPTDFHSIIFQDGEIAPPRSVRLDLELGDRGCFVPLPSGKHTKNHGKSPFLSWENSLFRSIFNSYHKSAINPHGYAHFPMVFLWFSIINGHFPMVFLWFLLSHRFRSGLRQRCHPSLSLQLCAVEHHFRGNWLARCETGMTKFTTRWCPPKL